LGQPRCDVRPSLPRLRESQGRIVFISSINGPTIYATGRCLQRSKFGIEAAADALRMELKPWVSPCRVEPGPTSTDITGQHGLPMPRRPDAGATRSIRRTHYGDKKVRSPSCSEWQCPPEKVATVVKRRSPSEPRVSIHRRCPVRSCRWRNDAPYLFECATACSGRLAVSLSGPLRVGGSLPQCLHCSCDKY